MVKRFYALFACFDLGAFNIKNFAAFARKEKSLHALCLCSEFIFSPQRHKVHKENLEIRYVKPPCYDVQVKPFPE